MAGLISTGSSPKSLLAGETPPTYGSSGEAEVRQEAPVLTKRRRQPPFSKKRLAFRESSGYGVRQYSGPGGNQS